MEEEIRKLREKELVRLVQKGLARIDVETGDVFSLSGEFNEIENYAGRLRKKLIPNRREMIKSKKLIENQVINPMQDKYNFALGHPYRIIVSGMNPMDNMTIDGILEKVDIEPEENGFRIKEIELRNGLIRDTYSPKRHFDREVIRSGDYNILGFGRILDEQGFCNARAGR